MFATPANQLSASKLTVREELAFGLENLGVPREEMDPRIDAMFERLGIAHLADREPFALSGGEQQRVAIASIVAMGTDVSSSTSRRRSSIPPAPRRSPTCSSKLAARRQRRSCAPSTSRACLAAWIAASCSTAGDRSPSLPGRALGRRGGALGLRPPTLVRPRR